jgi:RNA polymerase sigma factor FliA
MSEVSMATQAIPTYPQVSNRAIVPAIRPRLVPSNGIARPKVRASVQKEAEQAQQRQQRLIEMLPLVKRLAFKIREHLPAHVEFDDLLANGVLGLVDAVAKFDATKRVKLESYARHRIRGGILDGLRGADPASRDMRRKNKKIQQLYRQLEAKLGRPVTDGEIAAALGISLSRWHQTLNEVQGVGFDFGSRSISAGPTSKRPSAEPTLLADDHEDPFEMCYRSEQREILNRALSYLRERDRRIIMLYYHEELTMKQIADNLGVDESRVSQLHTAALARLKACVESILHPRAAASSRPTAVMSMAA